MQSNSTNKRCSKCRQTLPAANFYLLTRRNGRKYLSSYCRKCSTLVHYQWSLTDYGKERLAAFAAKRRQDNGTPEGKKALRRWHLKSAYGISEATYDAMFAKQKGVCAICYRPETYKSRRQDGSIRDLCVDHAHDGSRRIRGLLCAACNKALGLFKDDPLLLQNAISYLSQHQLG